MGVLDEQGESMQRDDLLSYAANHERKTVSISEVVEHRIERDAIAEFHLACRVEGLLGVDWFSRGYQNRFGPEQLLGGPAFLDRLAAESS